MEGILELVLSLSCYVLQTPLFWWTFIITSFYLIERLDLGIHSFRWRRSRDQGYCNGSIDSHEEETDGPNDKCQVRNGKNSNGHLHMNGAVFHSFIQKRVIPNFRSQCQEGEHSFSVLILSNITSVQDIERVKFRQVTFNGMPLVDSKRTMYPKPYRYENYIVARPDQSEHPEAMIMKEVPALVKAYGSKERCYIRNPVPKFGLLYSWTMPCSVCTKLIVKSLSKVCSEKVVLAYTRSNETEKESVVRDSHRILTSSGFMVVRVETV